MFDGMAVINFMGMTISNKYTQSLITLILFFIIAKTIAYIMEKYILNITSKTKTDVDDMLVKKTHIPISLLLFFLGVKIAIVPLELATKINTTAQRVVSTIATLLLSYILIVVFDILISSWIHGTAKKKSKEVDENLMKLSTKTSRILLIILVVLLILNLWDIKVSGLLASLGIVGIAVAFGLQNTLGNVFGGVSLLMDRSIKVGDIIRVDKDTAGSIIDVGLRATKLKTWDNELIIIPNGKLAGNNIKNYVLPNPKARIVVPFSVAYGSNVDDVKKVIMKEINRLDNLDKSNEPRVMFLEMGNSALLFKAFVWLKSYKERFTTKEKLNCMIYNALNNNGFNIPFPQMDVWIKEVSHGHRKKPKKSRTVISKKKIKNIPEDIEDLS
jgi:small-conductance mechanosensitive channel